MVRSAIRFCILALGLGLIPITPALAVPVTTTVSGSVDFAAANPFGLTTSDSVSAVAVYDDSIVPGAGAFDLAIDSDPTFSLTITLGLFVFQETDDSFFGSGFPALNFSNGNLVGIDFGITSFAFGAFPDLEVGRIPPQNERWFVDDFQNFPPAVTLLEGTWDFANAVTVPVNTNVPVPEPASWPLLASALAGLFIFQRRYRAAPRRPA